MMFESDKDRKLCVVCSNGKLQASAATKVHDDNLAPNDPHAGSDEEDEVRPS